MLYITVISTGNLQMSIIILGRNNGCASNMRDLLYVRHHIFDDFDRNWQFVKAQKKSMQCVSYHGDYN